jgi:hypothetical protein
MLTAHHVDCVKQHAPAANASGAYMKNVNVKNSVDLYMIQKSEKNKQHISPLANGKLTSFIQIGTFSSLPYRKGRNLVICRSKKQVDHYN